jgi:hypothetical protein
VNDVDVVKRAVEDRGGEDLVSCEDFGPAEAETWLIARREMRPMAAHRSGIAYSLCVVLGLAASCTGPTEADPDCSRAGCSDLLRVVLEELPPAPFRVEASTGEGARYVYECEEGVLCSEEIIFPFFLPDHVFIDLIVADDVHQFEFTPEYEEHRPNGPACPPVCQLGTLHVPVTALTAGEVTGSSFSFAIEGPGSCTG